MTSQGFILRYSRAATIIDKFYKMVESTGNYKDVNRCKHRHQQLRPPLKRQQFIDGAKLISELYFNEALLSKMTLPQHIEEMALDKNKMNLLGIEVRYCIRQV